jgi:hypothetical protein
VLILSAGLFIVQEEWWKMVRNRHSIIMFVVAIAVVCSVCIGEPVFAGSLVAWGNNDDGQGNAPDGNDFVAIAAGGEHSLALKLDGSLAAWGNNDYGQLRCPGG